MKDAALLAAAGLPALPPDGVALVQLLADDADALADGAAAASGPRVVTASLAEPEEKLQKLLLAHRLPTVIDFLGAIAWPKRAATLSHARGSYYHTYRTPCARAPPPRGIGKRARAARDAGEGICFYHLDHSDPIASIVWS